MRRLRGARVSPSLVISIAALVLAAGGTSFAQAPIALVAKAVGLTRAQKKQVKTIADREINTRSPKLSVLFAKLAGDAATAASAATATKAATATNAVNATHATTATHATSATNATKATDATNATNAGTAAAANSLNGVQIVAGPTAANPHGTKRTQEVACPPGMHAIGGGVIDSGQTEQSVNETFISGSNNVFVGTVNNTSPSTEDTFHVWALCANAAVTGTS
jgi:hypothetical protein